MWVLGPSGAGRSPASLPQAQGRALRLKTGGNGLTLSLLSGSWIGFGGRRRDPSVGPGGRSGPGEEGGACNRSETRGRGWKGLWKGAWLSRYGARAPSLLWGWDEGGSEELRRAASARRLRSSRRIGLPVSQKSGVRQCPARSGERASATAFEVAPAVPGETVA